MASAGLCESLSILVASLQPRSGGKKPGKLAMVKRCEVSRIASRIPPASLRKWAAVLAVK